MKIRSKSGTARKNGDENRGSRGKRREREYAETAQNGRSEGGESGDKVEGKPERGGRGVRVRNGNTKHTMFTLIPGYYLSELHGKRSGCAEKDE